MAFERALVRYADRLSVIDNRLTYVTSHMIGARGIELHPTNYWPQWGIKTWELLEAGEYAEAQRELVRVVIPFYEVWEEMAAYTGGDGYLDKLCLELIGLGTSRSRPPTRDVRDQFRERTREMLVRLRGAWRLAALRIAGPGESSAGRAAGVAGITGGLSPRTNVL